MSQALSRQKAIRLLETINSKLTSAKGTKGGPDAISAALVPGRILLMAPLSTLAIPAASGKILGGEGRPDEAVCDDALIVGDLRPI